MYFVQGMPRRRGSGNPYGRRPLSRMRPREGRSTKSNPIIRSVKKTRSSTMERLSEKLTRSTAERIPASSMVWVEGHLFPGPIDPTHAAKLSLELAAKIAQMKSGFQRRLGSPKPGDTFTSVSQKLNHHLARLTVTTALTQLGWTTRQIKENNDVYTLCVDFITEPSKKAADRIKKRIIQSTTLTDARILLHALGAYNRVIRDQVKKW